MITIQKYNAASTEIETEEVIEIHNVETEDGFTSLYCDRGFVLVLDEAALAKIRKAQ